MPELNVRGWLMAQSSTSRPVVPSDAQPGSSSSPASNVDGNGSGLELSLRELAATLSAHGAPDLATDLALDLILNSIVEQAKLATNATAAAIALATAGEMVCRATTGTNAPDLGVRLDSQYGLSGACVRSKIWQRCYDTETDSRVNAEACRYLGVRSILVYPLLKGEELLGVMEVFSSRPNAFSDREIHTLEALSSSVVENIDRVNGVFSTSIEDEAILSDLPQPELIAELARKSSEAFPSRAKAMPEFLDEVVSPLSPGDVAGPDKGPGGIEVPAVVPAANPRSDRWTGVLTVLVIGLAVTLGWLVGHVGQQPRTAVATPARVVPDHASQNDATQSPVRPKVNAEKAPRVSSAAPPEGRTETPPPGGLVVYDKGKVIFRTDRTQNTADASNGVSSASLRTKDSDAPGTPTTLSAETASQYLIGRVEPDYPEQAREQHLEGAVVLRVVVGADGSVENLTTVSGDPVLAGAATDAVRQWRFRPFSRNGRAQGFQTQVTVSFRMR
jgi:TonB family protein